MSEEEEIAMLDANPDVLPREELPDGVALVSGAITASDGGVNGLNPYQRLAITDMGGGEIQFILTDRETGNQQEFLVTVYAVEE